MTYTYTHVHAYLPNRKHTLCGERIHTILPRTRIRTHAHNKPRQRTKYVTCPTCKEAWPYIETCIELEHI